MEIETIKKAEMDRLVGTTLIPSYGKMPVHNKKFNQLIQYLEKKNKDLQVPNPTKKQIGLQDAINTQLNLERLKILAEDLKKSDKSISMSEKLLMLASFRNWCGLGTPIYENIKNDLDNPSKMFAIDTICRNHDMAYTKAKTYEDINKADDDMMEAILKKYILNFDKNFITGNYERDYSTWSSSFTSLYNQVISLFETGVAVNLIKKTGETFLNTAIEGVKLPFKIASYISKEYKRPSYRQLKLPYRHFTRNVGSSLKNVVKQSTILGISTVFRDKVLAAVSLFGIGFKKAIEEFFPIKLAKLSEHEVTDEQLNEIIRVFEILQNEYLTDSDMQPIKIGNQWENEEIQIPPIEELEKEITDIVVMNKQYVEKRYELAEQPQIVETISQEPQSDFLNEIDDELQTMIKELEGLEDTTYLNEIDNELETIMNELNTDEPVLNTRDVLNEEENIEEE
jgi:hypothetical protein